MDARPPRYFFDTSAIAKLYLPHELGHPVVDFLVRQFPTACWIPHFATLEILRVFQKHRNIKLNRPRARKKTIQNHHRALLTLWQLDRIRYWQVVPEPPPVYDEAERLLQQYDSQLKDASDAFILACALAFIPLDPSPMIFVSADEQTGLNPVARLEHLRVLNPDQATLPLTLP